MSTVKYSAKCSIKHYRLVKQALTELGIRHGPFQKGLLGNWKDTHFFDLYDSKAMPFLVLKLADTDFELNET